ncbi:MAG: DUF2459 domain-containing protein [Haliea sp.]|nr:DUF2459 domain-containing protein [Haliea sp.]
MSRLLLSCLLLLQSACHSLPDPAAVSFAPDDATLWVIYREWHTSLLFDGDLFRRYSRAWQRDPALQREAGGARMVRVSWGDGDYFTGKSKSAGTATRALFVSHYSALQFIGYEYDPCPRFPPTREPARVSEADIAALVAYIDASLLESGGALVPLRSYTENAGVFFESSKAYGLLNNCNTWTGEALQSAGLPVKSAFNLTSRSIFEQAQAITLMQGPAPAASGGVTPALAHYWRFWPEL